MPSIQSSSMRVSTSAVPSSSITLVMVSITMRRYVRIHPSNWTMRPMISAAPTFKEISKVVSLSC